MNKSVAYLAQAKEAGISPQAQVDDRRMAMAATILAGLLASKYAANFEYSATELDREDAAREALLLVYAIEDELDIFGK